MNRTRLSALLLLAGVILLAVSLGQYGYMALRQHELLRQWNRIHQPIRTLPAGTAFAHVVATGAGGPLRIEIPSIHLDDAVVSGTDYEDLLVAPGLLEGSPLPSLRGGNTVIAGHRDTFFRHVADLRPGAEVVLRSAGGEFDYRVTGREIVKPTQTSVLDSTPDPQLTLVTCYPTYWIGPAPDRLIVQAKLVGEKR